MATDNQPATRQDAVDAVELETLHRQWGNFPVEHVTLDVASPFLTGDNQLLASRGRRAEVCYVMRRGTQEEILLHIKRFYPPQGYRLPTGGIQQGEAVMETLAREIWEETGQSLTKEDGAAQVVVEACLGVVAYTLRHNTLGDVPFATYCFAVRMPEEGVLAPQDADEQIAGWRWLPPAQLPTVAETLAHVGQTHPIWADWGRFRAVSHRFVAKQITGNR
jgi:8-oxo-dGTP pyrophosphatase MutT (NUDIX family)